MRDWNTILYKSKKAKQRSVAYLWGIETRIPFFNDFIKMKVCSVPMRDWNNSKKQRGLNPRLVCSVPMRDWNCLSNQKEGLVCTESVAYLWGIETFWNKSNCCCFEYSSVAYLWGIETRGNVFRKPMPFFVCSVPMRDWNLYSELIRPSLSMSVAYLWGIETSFKLEVNVITKGL